MNFLGDFLKSSVVTSNPLLAIQKTDFSLKMLAVYKMLGIFGLLILTFNSNLIILGNTIVEKNSSIDSELTNSNLSGYKVYRLIANSPEDFAILNKLYDEGGLDFWKEPSLGGNTDVMINKQQEIDLKNTIKDHEGITYSVLIDSLGPLIPSPKTTRFQQAKKEMSWDEYHYLEVIVEWMEKLAENYPDLATIETIGETSDGNPLVLMKISTSEGNWGYKKAVFIDATTHAREWITPAVATYIINELVTKSLKYQDILQSYDFYILPVMNPDGYIHSCYYNRLWRKTRKGGESFMSKFMGCPGIDLNRNFGYHWGGPGSSSFTCSPVYRGTHSFSELESASVRKFVLGRPEVKWTAYFSLHSYGQKWMTPWGYTNELPEDYDELVRVAEIGAKALRRVHGTEFSVGSTTDQLYLASGGSDDWFKGVVGCKYSYTLELRDSGTYGFLLPAGQIQPTSEETWAGIYAALKSIPNSPN